MRVAYKGVLMDLSLLHIMVLLVLLPFTSTQLPSFFSNHFIACEL